MKSLYNYPGLLLAMTSLFWAGNFVIGRAVVGVVPPVTLATTRWLLAFLILLPFALRHLREDRQKIAAHWPILLFLGVIGPGCYNTLSYIGLVSTEAMNAFMLNAAGPIFIVLVAWLTFGDRVTVRQMIGLAVGFVGVVIIIAKGDPALLLTLRINQGDALLLLGLVTWALYTAYLRKKPHISWQSFCAVTFGISGIGNIPFAATELALTGRPEITAEGLAAIVYVAIFPSIIAYIFYNRGVELLGPARSAPYLFLVTLFGSVLAAIFLGEKLYLFHGVGFAFIACGVLLGTSHLGAPQAAAVPEPHR